MKNDSLERMLSCMYALGIKEQRLRQHKSSASSSRHWSFIALLGAGSFLFSENNVGAFLCFFLSGLQLFSYFTSSYLYNLLNKEVAADLDYINKEFDVYLRFKRPEASQADPHS